jgi:multicomponent Na+:H+ antiporter subunit B
MEEQRRPLAEQTENKPETTPEQPPRKALGIIVRYGANLFLPLACTFGGYVVLHGDSSPGGGFQGGVLIASAVLLVFLGYGTQKLSTTFKASFLHNTETVAEIMYIAIGLIGVLVGLNFAVNFVMSTFHIETAMLMNNAVGYHVMAGIGCLLIMMLGMLGTTDNGTAVPDQAEPETPNALDPAGAPQAPNAMPAREDAAK